MAKKLGLGSGLSSLFASSLDSVADDATITVLRISQIEQKKTQPRKNFNEEALRELADSISKYGIIQPIVVRKLDSGKYQIIAGERRWRAAKIANLYEVPVVIKDVDDLTAAEMTMVENLQREDLNPIEEALGYKYLSETYSLTQEEIAKQVAKSRSVISNSMRLLSLPEKVLEHLAEGSISAGHARAILSLDGEEAQIQMAERIIKNDLSVREVERFAKESRLNRTVKAFIGHPAPEAKDEASTPSKEDYFEDLQKRLTGALGKKIVISRAKRQGAKNGGRLEIEYRDEKDLENIVKLLIGEKTLENN